MVLRGNLRVQSNCSERPCNFGLVPPVPTDLQQTWVTKPSHWTHALTQIPASILSPTRRGWLEALEMEPGYIPGYKSTEKELQWGFTAPQHRHQEEREQGDSFWCLLSLHNAPCARTWAIPQGRHGKGAALAREAGEDRWEDKEKLREKC